MTNIYRDYCGVCKTKEGPFVYYASHVVKQGRAFYARCRPCQAAKERKYRTTESGKVNTYAAVRRSIKKNPLKDSARQKVKYALRVGKISKKDCPCGSTVVQAHHPDYSQPLEVLWLCSGCHADIHQELVLNKK